MSSNDPFCCLFEAADESSLWCLIMFHLMLQIWTEMLNVTSLTGLIFHERMENSN